MDIDLQSPIAWLCNLTLGTLLYIGAQYPTSMEMRTDSTTASPAAGIIYLHRECHYYLDRPSHARTSPIHHVNYCFLQGYLHNEKFRINLNMEWTIDER